MATSEGNCGRGNIWYGADELAVLRGVLAADLDDAVYPEDRCLECEREGRVRADERCFHRHWRASGEDAAPHERRVDSTSNQQEAP